MRSLRTPSEAKNITREYLGSLQPSTEMIQAISKKNPSEESDVTVHPTFMRAQVSSPLSKKGEKQ